MRALVIGSAGREHAFAWKLAQSDRIETVYVLPGNAGTAQEAKCQNVAIDSMDNEAIVRFCCDHQIHFVLIGPEAPLANGVVDALAAVNIPCIGPTQAAAKLESSKAFCKDFLARHQIPTAQYAVFHDQHQAIEYVKQHAFPCVIKADGIAAGKGVTIAHDLPQALSAIEENLSNHRFGVASQTIVIEEFLTGIEASFIVLCDGKHVIPLASAQDHKARDEGGQGPNTGGMGAYSPAPIVTPACHEFILQHIIAPTLDALQAENIHYQGFLYAGLMIDPHTETAKLLEYNTRCGDPETEVILMRWQDDFAEICLAVIEQRLDTVTTHWDPRAALGVMLCAGGYPLDFRSGDKIHGLEHALTHEGKVFHAGTCSKDNHTVTHGGRVLCVTALGQDVATAHHYAYQNLTHIHWDDLYYRKDIGRQAFSKA